MSNYLAIASVTATLRDMLESALPSKLGALVKQQHPAKVDGSETAVNIYLYQVCPNPSRRNEDLPTRHGTSLVRRPRLALDLFYLVSCYGDERQMVPQRLLGAVMSALHVNPFLDKRAVVRAVENPKRDYLEGSDLADSVKEIRITPLTMNLEEFSRVWSGFFPSVPYTISVIYKVSVVMIDAGVNPASPPGVEDRSVNANPRSHT